MYYRKKPLVVEAIQIKYNNLDKISKFIKKDINIFLDNNNNLQFIYIPTLEGDMRAAPGDWVIKGINGEFYSCKSNIFDLSYEEYQENKNKNENKDLKEALPILKHLLEVSILGHERNDALDVIICFTEEYLKKDIITEIDIYNLLLNELDKRGQYWQYELKNIARVIYDRIK